VAMGRAVVFVPIALAIAFVMIPIKNNTKLNWLAKIMQASPNVWLVNLTRVLKLAQHDHVGQPCAFLVGGPPAGK
jgi:hypothetical protein